MALWHCSCRAQRPPASFPNINRSEILTCWGFLTASREYAAGWHCRTGTGRFRWRKCCSCAAVNRKPPLWNNRVTMTHWQMERVSGDNNKLTWRRNRPARGCSRWRSGEGSEWSPMDGFGWVVLARYRPADWQASYNKTDLKKGQFLGQKMLGSKLGRDSRARSVLWLAPHAQDWGVSTPARRCSLQVISF